MSKREIKWGEKHIGNLSRILDVPNTYVDFETFNYYSEDLNERQKNLKGSAKYEKLKLTKSRYISQRQSFSNYKYLLETRGSHISLFISDERGVARISYRNGADEKKPDLTGSQAFWKLVNELKKDNVNLFDYQITKVEGFKAYQTDHLEGNRLIKVVAENLIDAELENVHHLDLRSAYPAGVAHYFPEFRPTLERLFNSRGKIPEYKSVLNYSIGMLESNYTGYRFNHIALAAHRWTKLTIEGMARKIKRAGGIVLLYNTDGIWYQGERVKIQEANELGNWNHDYTNCKFRMRSAGAYEFIENDEYNVRLRGRTILDKIKPRSRWEWGDIYQKTAEIQEFIEIKSDIDDELKLVKVMKEVE